MIVVKKKFILPGIILGCSAVLVLLGVLCVRNMGPWLVLADTAPDSLDVIYTFGGDVERFEFSKQYYEKYPTALWYLSTGEFRVYDTVTLGLLTMEHLQRNGYDLRRIALSDTCTSTFSELVLLVTTAKAALAGDSAVAGVAQGAQFYRWPHPLSVQRPLRIGLVSDPYHMRRISLWARRLMPDARVQLYYLPVNYGLDIKPFLQKRKWWQFEKDTEIIVGEYIKMAVYALVYRHQGAL